MATPTEKQKEQPKSQPELSVSQIKQSQSQKLLADIVAYIESSEMKSSGYSVEANATVIRIKRHVFHNVVCVLHNGSAAFYESDIRERLIKKFPDYRGYFNGDKMLTD